MTDNAPPPSAWQHSSAPLKPLSLAMPWQQGNNAAQTNSHKLGLASSLGALSLAPAAPALAQWGQQWPQAQLWQPTCGQQLGQPFGQLGQLGQLVRLARLLVPVHLVRLR